MKVCRQWKKFVEMAVMRRLKTFVLNTKRKSIQRSACYKRERNHCLLQNVQPRD